MKTILLTVLVCLAVPCWGEEPAASPSDTSTENPIFQKRDSPTTLIERNQDGTLLVSLKPQVYLDELGCIMVADEQGNTFSQMHYIIAFSLQEVRYWTIWGTSPGGGPPVKLDSRVAYKCLIRPLASDQNGEDVPFSILKIWNGSELVYEQK